MMDSIWGVIAGEQQTQTLTSVAARPELRRWQRLVTMGQPLFRQGQMAESAFVILEGVVRLVGDRSGTDFSEGAAGPGEILGERVLTEHAPYPRRYGALAQTDVRVLEIPRNDFLQFEKDAPTVANALYRAALAVTQTRLQRMHYLVRALRPTSLDRRVAGLASYFHRTLATLGPGAAVSFNAAAVAEYVDLDEVNAEAWLDKLAAKGFLAREATGTYRVTDSSGLYDVQEQGLTD